MALSALDRIRRIFGIYGMPIRLMRIPLSVSISSWNEFVVFNRVVWTWPPTLIHLTTSIPLLLVATADSNSCCDTWSLRTGWLPFLSNPFLLSLIGLCQVERLNFNKSILLVIQVQIQVKKHECPVNMILGPYFANRSDHDDEARDFTGSQIHLIVIWHRCANWRVY